CIVSVCVRQSEVTATLETFSSAPLTAIGAAVAVPRGRETVACNPQFPIVILFKDTDSWWKRLGVRQLRAAALRGSAYAKGRARPDPRRDNISRVGSRGCREEPWCFSRRNYSRTRALNNDPHGCLFPGSRRALPSRVSSQ